MISNLVSSMKSVRIVFSFVEVLTKGLSRNHSHTGCPSEDYKFYLIEEVLSRIEL